jgi:hypothetical protein
LELGKSFYFINIYGPNDNGVDYWEKMLAREQFKKENIILGMGKGEICRNS